MIHWLINGEVACGAETEALAGSIESATCPECRKLPPLSAREEDSVDRWWDALQKASKGADTVSGFDQQMLKERRDDARSFYDSPAY